jgi:hypothetical protein
MTSGTPSGRGTAEAGLIAEEEYGALSRKPTMKPAKTIKKSAKDATLIRVALHRSRFFTCLDAEQIQRFVDVAQLRTYLPGTAVIRQGSVDDDNPEGQVAPMDSLGPLGIESVIKETRLGDELRRFVGQQQQQQTTIDQQLQAAINDADVNVNLASAIRIATEQGNEEEEEDKMSSGAGDLDDEIERNETSLVRRQSAEQLGVPSFLTSRRMTKHQESNENLAIYAVRSGSGEVWVNGTNPSSLGRGNVFGEGAVLFNRAHGATVIASGGAEEEASNNNTDDDNILECWVVPAEVFRNYVLHSENMIDMFQKHAHRADESGEPYITMVSWTLVSQEPHCIRM